MSVYDTDGLLIVHAVENTHHMRAAQGRLHGHHLREVALGRRRTRLSG